MVILQAIVDKINKITPEPEADAAQSVVSSGNAWDSFIQLIGLIILLLLILAATYFTTRIIGNIKLGQMKNSNFKLIDAYRISPGKVIQIVKIGSKYIVLAICKDTINYITELDEEDIVFREYQTREKLSFETLLSKIRNNR